MDFTALVDVAIGLTVVYLGASLFVTSLNEYVSQSLKLRGRQLGRLAKVLTSLEAVQKDFNRAASLRNKEFSRTND